MAYFVRARFLLCVLSLFLTFSHPGQVFCEASGASVQWQPWSEASFQKAKAEKKLVLLDVSAAWCHWCHVMEETTYRDPAVLDLIGKHFVPIKVDVDARPDIAQRYGPIGWPATAFFTPDAQTILEVGAYIDPKTFQGFLHKVLDSYAKGTWKNSASTPSPTSVGEGGGEGAIRSTNAWAEKELLAYYDPDLSGCGKQQKAPIADAVEHALWKAYKTGDKAWGKKAYSTLLTQRVLLDPVWGGVYQYSVGGGWNRPHFEKIMTVQAGALENFAQAYRAGGDSRFLAMARMMVDYFNHFLWAPEGGFYTSQDADMAGTDGNDYFCLSDKERRRIGIPRVDTHVYTRENGLAIAAFCKAYAATLDPAVLERALKAADGIWTKNSNGRGGLFHEAGQSENVSYLADNAAMGKALIDCYEATGQTRYLNAAKDVAGFMLRELIASDKQGFFAATQDPHATGIFAQRQKPFQENVLAARFLWKLYGHIKEPALKEATEKTLSFLSDEAKLKEEGRFIGNYLLATEEYLNDPVHLLVLGSASDPRAAALHKAALAYYAPHKILEWQDPKKNPEITKAYPAFDHPVLYVCGSNRCSSPISDPKGLSESIDEFLKS